MDTFEDDFDFDADGAEDYCLVTGGAHSWVIADKDNGGDGRCYCEFCCADGDA